MSVLRAIATTSLLFAVACSGARNAARSAIGAADTALAVIGPEAGRVVPDSLAPLAAAVAAAKDSFDAGRFQAAAALVQDIPSRANDLAQTVVREKSAITEEINTLSVAMPRNLALLKGRLDRYPGRRLPPRVGRETFDSARTAWSEGVDEWPRIMTAFNAGNLNEAITRATALRLRVSRAMEIVGLAADARAWGNEVSPQQ